MEKNYKDIKNKIYKIFEKNWNKEDSNISLKLNSTYIMFTDFWDEDNTRMISIDSHFIPEIYYFLKVNNYKIFSKDMAKDFIDDLIFILEYLSEPKGSND